MGLGPSKKDSKDGGLCWRFQNWSFEKQKTVAERDFTFNNTRFTGAGKQIRMKGIYIWYARFKAHTNLPVQIGLDDDHVQMTFCLEGEFSYLRQAPARPFVSFSPQQHNMILLPKADLLVQWKPGTQIELFFDQF